jgi:type I restriction enzyme R subunit
MPAKSTARPTSDTPPSVLREDGIEYGFIAKLQGLKYEYRPDITDRATLEQNFREKFESLNRVRLTDGEFARLLDEIITPDVFAAAKTLRGINAFTRDDGTPLNYTLVNIKDWCKNHYEVINQLRINTANSHHRYDVIILINGVPVAQIELKTLGVSPRRAMEQIVEYKNDSGNGYTRTLLCFLQLFIVSNRDRTFYFANNNARHFAFHAEERFLPVYEFADEDKELAAMASKHHLATASLQTFVDGILDRMIFDGEQLSDLMAPLDLGWKARTQAELALMEDCAPYLTKRAGGRDISGLSAYEQ